jgi:hypothetical protein
LEREHCSLAPFHQLKGHVSNTSTRASLAVDDDHEFIKDLESLINLGCRSIAIYNYLVSLYAGFGLRYQAVELLLKVDPALVRELARESVGNDERKRPWLMIARNAAAEHEHREERDIATGVEKVVSILKD